MIKFLRHFSLSLIILTLLVTALAVPGMGLAQTTSGYGLTETGSAAGLPTGSVPQFLGQVAGGALALAGSIFLFLIIYGGIIIMTSEGGERLAKGKKIITWAIIGALFLGAAYGITTLVFSIFTTK